MNALRTRITLLVMGAIIAMSVIGISAAASVSALLQPVSGVAVMFRYSPVANTHAALPAAVPETVPQAGDENFPLKAVVLGYALLIVSCSATVGLIVANMVVRPMAILEGAVNSVDSEGFIPEIEEAGLGETLETVRLINRLSARLRSAMQSRMRLVAAAGHDLRTPMTRMRLRAEFIEDDEERSRWMRDIDELTHIADSAIRLVREEAFSEESHHVDLDVLVAELCDELREIGHSVTSGTLEQARVRGGWHSLKRAASNLAVNAATHGGSAEITLSRHGSVARIEIADRGPGIPEDKIGQAFEPFFRADPARQKNLPGAGLGLAIAKEIVTRHGGTVRIANRQGGGLLQTIDLPALEA